MCNYTGSHFGASYPDACCIEGRLWDLDSCDEPGGGLSIGGEIPCPSCETEAYLYGDVEEYYSLTGNNWGEFSGAMCWEGKVRYAAEINIEMTLDAIKKNGAVETLDFKDRTLKDWNDTVDRTYITEESLAMATNSGQSARSSPEWP